MRRVPSTNTNSTVHRESDRGAFVRLLLVLVISLVCAGGFVLAARQHVSAVKLGYQTQELRREREKLKADHGQLKSAREQALSPARLSAEAQKLGLQLTTVKQLDSEASAGDKPRSADRPAKAGNRKATAKRPAAKEPGRQPAKAKKTETAKR